MNEVERPECQETTNGGTRCKIFPLYGEVTCRAHTSQQRLANRVAEGEYCRLCNRGLTLDSFTKSGLKNQHCRECANARQRKRWRACKTYIDEIKQTTPCTDCGGVFHPAAMHFDHIRPDQKTREIAGIVASGAMSTLLAELELCELVCANCHAVRTASDGAYRSGKKGRAAKGWRHGAEVVSKAIAAESVNAGQGSPGQGSPVQGRIVALAANGFDEADIVRVMAIEGIDADVVSESLAIHRRLIGRFQG